MEKRSSLVCFTCSYIPSQRMSLINICASAEMSKHEKHLSSQTNSAIVTKLKSLTKSRMYLPTLEE